MVKTTVYLSEATKRRLAELAKLEGRSEAALIREAIDRLVDESTPPRRPRALFTGPGDGLSERVDEELAKGFGEW